MAASLKASLSNVTVSAAVFPKRKQNFRHTSTLRSAIWIYKKNCQRYLQTLRKNARRYDTKHV